MTDINATQIEEYFYKASEGWNWKDCQKTPRPSGRHHRTRDFWGDRLSVSSLAWIGSYSCSMHTKICALGVGSNFHLDSNTYMHFGNLVHNALVPRVESVMRQQGVVMEVERRYSASLPGAPTIEISGRLDGVIPETVLIELKNRYPGHTQAGIKPYEALQASIYAVTCNLPICLVVAQYNDEKPTFKAHWLSVADARKRLDVVQSLVKHYATVAFKKLSPPIENANCNHCPQGEQCGIPKATMLCSHCQRPITLDTLHLIPRGRAMPVGIHYCGHAYLVKKGDEVEISPIKVSGDKLLRDLSK